MSLVKFQSQPNMFRRANDPAGLIDSFFDDFFTPMVSTVVPKSVSEARQLRVDIFEKDNNVIITAEIPGVKKEDIFVDAKGKFITIGGERKSEEEVKEEKWYRMERVYGKFERTFSLPFNVNVDDVKATFKDGILRLEIPKPEEKDTVKKIAIE